MSFDRDDPWQMSKDGVYVEQLNSSSLLSGMFNIVGVVDLPQNYRNKIFDNTETSKRARFMKVALVNLTGTNNGNTLVLNSGDSFTLDCTIFLALFNNLQRFKIDSTIDNFSIAVFDKDNNKIRDISNGEDLTNYNITDDEFKIKVMANASTTIDNIHFEVFTKKSNNDSKVTIAQEQILGLKEQHEKNFDMLYPVGIVIEMDSDANPNNTMRGTWERFAENKFTLGSGSSYSRGQTGGTAAHILTSNEMPTHTHIQNAHTHTQQHHTHTQNAHSHTLSAFGSGGSIWEGHTMRVTPSSSSSVTATWANFSRTTSSVTPTNQNTTAINSNTTGINQNTGGGQSHNNMPPYVVVNKWKRTA